jgi:hypothetical protein
MAPILLRLAGPPPFHDPHDLLEAHFDLLVVKAVAAVIGEKLPQVGDDLRGGRLSAPPPGAEGARAGPE